MNRRPGLRRIARVAAAVVVTLLAASAPALTDPGAPPPLAGIAHIAIRVHDLAASTAFYQKLGYEQPFALDHNGQVNEAFVKVNDTQFIELYPTTTKNPDPSFLHLCFEGVDLETVYQDYITRGLTPRSKVRKAGAGNLLFTMNGPDQPFGPQNIEYTQYQPGSRHWEDRGKNLGSNRVADKLLVVTLAVKDPAAARDFYVNQLEFKPVTGSMTLFHLPGDSGEQVELVPAATLGNRARITLQTQSLSRSEHLLRKQHIAFTKVGSILTVLDPDGNIIRIVAR
ncbi:VOC family protein [Edaphobacter sp.]|uniref:VOC family protein n=1 Tax=Edaphobacter sp. TaxID=1934404 RepID=UPI002DB9BFA6|nr:VOC family protein [Edaphobacter sp.]HEU5342619.1 VOC family protein [Edaphobacter sp.]